MELEKMYLGKVNSPTVFLVREIDKEETEIEITDSTVLPQAPNIACIGIGEETETILYEEIEGNTLKKCKRGFQGTAKTWEKMTPVARIFTEYDLGSLQKNVTNLNTELNLKANLVSPSFTGVPTAPTPATTTNNTQIATTAFVNSKCNDRLSLAGGTIDGNLTVIKRLQFLATTGQNCIGEGYNKDGGKGDGSTVDNYNFSLNGWWGMGFRSSQGDKPVTGIYDFRAGRFSVQSAFTGLVNNTCNLGTAGMKFANIYASTGTINTSDKNEKEKIKPLSETTKDFIMSLNPVEYEFKGEEYLRTHYGLIAQEVEQAMHKNDMNSLDFAGLIISPITEEVETEEFKEEKITDEDGREKITKVPVMKTEIIGETYGLRYEEFIAPLIKVVQLQEDKIAKLEEKIDKLENLINK